MTRTSLTLTTGRNMGQAPPPDDCGFRVLSLSGEGGMVLVDGPSGALRVNPLVAGREGIARAYALAVDARDRRLADKSVTPPTGL